MIHALDAQLRRSIVCANAGYSSQGPNAAVARKCNFQVGRIRDHAVRVDSATGANIVRTICANVAEVTTTRIMIERCVAAGTMTGASDVLIDARVHVILADISAPECRTRTREFCVVVQALAGPSIQARVGRARSCCTAPLPRRNEYIGDEKSKTIPSHI